MKRRERIRLFCAIAKCIARYFGCTIPRESLLDLLRSSSKIVGGEGKLSACIHIHDTLSCYIERYANDTRNPPPPPSKSMFQRREECNGTPRARVRCVTVIRPDCRLEEHLRTSYSQSTFGPFDPASAVPIDTQELYLWSVV
jgi:hypothetical protein